MSESSKAATVEIDCERRVAEYKSVEPNIELFASYQKWIIYISLGNIRLSCMVFPLSHLG